MKSCTNCGCVLDSDDTTLCPVCGARLEKGPDRTPVSSADGTAGEAPDPALAFSPFHTGTLRSVVRTAGVLVLAGGALLLLNAAIRNPYGEPPIPVVETDFTDLDGPELPEIPEPVSKFLDTAADDLQHSLGMTGEEEQADTTGPQVVLHGALPDAVITVDGQPVDFAYEGEDALVPQDLLTAPCAVRIVAPSGDGWQTAAVWYDGSATELTLGAEDGYGAYTSCDESGLAAPSVQFVDGLTRAYYLSFLQSINEQDSSLLRFTTDANRQMQEDSIYGESNAKNLYDTQNFTAACEPSSVLYNDGQVLYNASFVCYPTNRTTGESKTISNHRTIRLVWDGAQWLVDFSAFLSEPDFAAGNYRTG